MFRFTIDCNRSTNFLLHIPVPENEFFRPYSNSRRRISSADNPHPIVRSKMKVNTEYSKTFKSPRQHLSICCLNLVLSSIVRFLTAIDTVSDISRFLIFDTIFRTMHEFHTPSKRSCEVLIFEAVEICRL